MQSKPTMQGSTGYIAVSSKPYDLSKFSWWFGV